MIKSCGCFRWAVLSLISSWLVLIGAPSCPALGQTILSVDGTPTGGGWVVIYNGQGFASSWSQTNRFTNVTVSAHLGAFGVPGQTGRAFLTTRLGPGTTLADEVASVQFTFPLVTQDVPLFRGLTLEAGTYFLSMVGDSGTWGSGWFSACPSQVVAADGVFIAGDYGLWLAPYLPASGLMFQDPIMMRIRVVAETNLPPGPPTEVALNLQTYTTPAEILLTWEAYPGAVQYLVQRQTSEGNWQSVSGPLAAREFRDSKFLMEAVTYRVVGATASGLRFESETVQTAYFNPLIRLSGMTVRPVNETTVSIDWTVNAPYYSDWGSPAPGGARPRLEIGNSLQTLQQVEWSENYSTSGHHVVSNLVPNTSYWFRLTLMGTNHHGLNYLNEFVTRPAPDVPFVEVNVVAGNPVLTIPQGDPVRFRLVSGQPGWTFTITREPWHGVIVGDSSEFLFTPAADWFGPDSFAFLGTDGIDAISGEVFINATPVNHAPVALEGAIPLGEDSSIELPLRSLDFDSVFSQNSTFELVSGPEHGSLQGWTYTPAPNFVGVDRVTFRAMEGSLTGSVASVRIVVWPSNDSPFAQEQSVVTFKNTARSIILSAGDPDSDLLQLVITALPGHGTLSLRGIGTVREASCYGLSELIYTPYPDFVGDDVFQYRVQDGNLWASPATVNIAVLEPNHPPQAISQSLVTESGVPISVTLSGTDSDGQALTFCVVTGPVHGSLSGALPGQIYSPVAGFAGTDTFAFAANDGQTSSVPASVTVTVLPAGAAPLAPVGLVATLEPGRRIALQWTDRSSYEKGFRIERLVEGGPFKQVASVNANVVTYLDGGLQSGKSYRYRVVAYNKGGETSSNITPALLIP